MENPHDSKEDNLVTDTKHNEWETLDSFVLGLAYEMEYFPGNEIANTEDDLVDQFVERVY